MIGSVAHGETGSNQSIKQQRSLSSSDDLAAVTRYFHIQVVPVYVCVCVCVCLCVCVYVCVCMHYVLD